MCWLIKSAFENEIFFVSRNFFGYYDFKNGCKKEFEDNNENHAADSKIRSLQKILDFIADGAHESHPTALKLI